MSKTRALLHHELLGTKAPRDGVPRPVLLLRPIAGTARLWGELATRLARNRLVITCEARGIGRSPPARLPTTTRTMAADVAQLIEALSESLPEPLIEPLIQPLGGGRVHVFGLSLGGMIATQLAAERPDQIAGLVLGSTPLTGRSLARDPLHHRAFARCLTKRRGEREACLAAHALSSRFVAEQPERTAAILDEVRREGGSLRSLSLHAAAGMLHDARDAAPKIAARTLCIAGELDELVGATRARELVSQIPGAELAVMRGVGHDLSLEAPAELAELVEQHCAACDALEPRELVFAYNADGGVASQLLDAAHKLISPATYPCSLCALTYGPVTMRAAWSTFVATLPAPARFVHRDELPRGAQAVALPALLEHRGDAWRVLLDRSQIDACRDLDALIAAVRAVV